MRRWRVRRRSMTTCRLRLSRENVTSSCSQSIFRCEYSGRFDVILHNTRMSRPFVNPSICSLHSQIISFLCSTFVYFDMTVSGVEKAVFCSRIRLNTTWNTQYARAKQRAVRPATLAACTSRPCQQCLWVVGMRRVDACLAGGEPCWTSGAVAVATLRGGNV